MLGQLPTRRFCYLDLSESKVENGGHGFWFPAVRRGAPIPIVMLLRINVSTVMSCVRVDELDHYHFIEEPRRRLPLHHPWDTTSCSHFSIPTNHTTAGAVSFCQFRQSSNISISYTTH